MGIIKNIIKGALREVVQEKSFLSQGPSYWANISGEKKTKLTDPYRQHPTVYACVNAKAKNLAQVPIKFYNMADEEVTKGLVNDLFKSINPLTTQSEFVQGVVVSLDSSGNAYIVKDENTVSGVPVYIWIKNPNDVRPKENSSGIWTGWEVKQGGQWVFKAKEDVIHIKYWSPYCEVLGMSPLTPLHDELEADYNAINYNKMFFLNGGTAGNIFTTEQNLSPASFDRLKDNLVRKRQGTDNAHKDMVLDSGLKIDRSAPTARDMEFLSMRKWTRDQVASTLGVPKETIQLYEDINYATAVASDASFWKKTLIPLGRLIEDAINQYFLNEFKIYMRFDFSGIAALSLDMLNKSEAAKTFWLMGAPFNQVNERLNLGFEDVPNGDLPRPTNSLDVTADTKQLKFPKFEQPKPALTEFTKAGRAAIWKKLDDKILPEMGRASAAMKQYYRKVEQKLYSKLNKNFMGQTVMTKDTQATYDSIASDVRQMFADDEMRKDLSPYILEALIIGYLASKNTTNSAVLTVSQTDLIESVLAKRLGRLERIGDTSAAKVIDSIEKALATSIKEGLTEQQATDLLISELKKDFKELASHAKTIARTEINGAFNEANYIEYQDAGVEKIMWISSRDKAVRDSHAYVDGQVIKLGDVFANGLHYPQDPTGPAAEIINCRCRTVAVKE